MLTGQIALCVWAPVTSVLFSPPSLGSHLPAPHPSTPQSLPDPEGGRTLPIVLPHKDRDEGP